MHEYSGPIAVSETLPERKLAAILYADIVGYSRQMAADETDTLLRLKALHTSLIEPAISARRGRIVKLIGGRNETTNDDVVTDR